jgi:hypothetical protein
MCASSPFNPEHLQQVHQLDIYSSEQQQSPLIIFQFSSFSFPSCSRKVALFVHVVTGRARGVTKRVHYIAFFGGAPPKLEFRFSETFLGIL